MIAPLPQTGPERSPVHRHVRAARRLVASTFLPAPARAADDAPSIPVWRAWLFAAWVLVVTAVYFASMLGRL